ncbi:hypothetical protein EPN90_01840 [Patescibacteria group bacterium]|nr:MAG: hypothetical protein EPN90_01840 [Patescibacteria group bacterium]
MTDAERFTEVLRRARELLKIVPSEIVGLAAKPKKEKNIPVRGTARTERLEQESEKRSEELEREVQELYSEPDGSIPDLSRLERGGGHRVRNVLLTLTFVFGLLAAAAWAGFFVFKPYEKFSPRDLVFAVEVPEKVKSGEEITAKIRYSAPAKVALGKLGVSLKLPKEFALAESSPAPTEGLNWVLGALAPGDRGEIELKGTVRGAPETLLTIQAFATYVPANFNSEFQNVASAAFVISGSTLSLTATSTERALPGEPVSATFIYRNDGVQALAAAAFRATLPASFVAATSTPPSSEGAGFWQLGKLEPGALGQITLHGTFSSEAKGLLAFGGELGFKENGVFVPQAATTTPVTVTGGDLVLNTIVNGATEGTAVNFGERVHATVAYANKSEAMLEDIVLTMNLLGVPVQEGKLVFERSTLVDSAKGEFATTTLRWSKKEIPKLAKLAPGEEGTFDVSFRLVAAPYLPAVKDYSLDLWVAGVVGKVNGAPKNRRVQSAKFHFPFLSDTKLVAQSRYYNDDEIAVGTGPLPPKVGQETTYRIFWTVENSLHELANLSLKAALPENVRFTGKSDISAGTLGYIEGTRTISWSLNKLPVGAPKVTIDFEVGLTPSAAALGNILPLTGDASFDAEDTVVGGHLIKTAESVDTSLTGDPLGRGKGVVGQ